MRTNEFVAMRKKGFAYDCGLQKWVEEPVGMYGNPDLAQLFRPAKRTVGRFQRGQVVAKPMQMSFTIHGVCDAFAPRCQHGFISAGPEGCSFFKD